MAERIDAVVTGAGVVGLACVRAPAKGGRKPRFWNAMMRSARKSVRATARSFMSASTIRYARSRKAGLCVSGRAALYGFCNEFGVSHRRCGKLIVATHTDQEQALASIRKHAEINGVSDIQALSAEQAWALEPEVRCSAALFSPTTGIIDSHGLMLALLGDAERHEASLALRSPVLSGLVAADRIVLTIGGADPMELHATNVVNAAGLSATLVAASISGLPATALPSADLAKGNYFSLAGKAPFSRLVFPLPEPGGLGLYLTLDLAGHARFGPDVE